MFTFKADTGFLFIGNEPLDAIQQEHVMILMTLQTKAESILGNAFEFEKWLHALTPNNNDLSSLLSTPKGVETLSNELDRIAEGYPA